MMLLLCCVLAALPTRKALAGVVPITHCGQVITGAAALSGDLSCPPGAPSLEIVRGKLRLNGFSISGDAIECAASCTVTGPGNLDADVRAHDKLLVRDLTSTGWLRSLYRSVKVSGCDLIGGGVYAETGARAVDSTLLGACLTTGSERGKAKAIGTTIEDCPGTAVVATKAVVIDSTILRSSGSGVVGWDVVGFTFRTVGKVRIINSTIAENAGNGVSGGVVVSVRNSTIRDNGGSGLRAFHHSRSDSSPVPVGGIRAMQSSITGNRYGIFGNRVRVDDSLVIGNGIRGVEANTLTVRGVSDLRGNGLSPDCQAAAVCLDVLTSEKPYGVNSSNCDSSGRLRWLPGFGLDTGSWNLCSGDGG